MYTPSVPMVVGQVCLEYEVMDGKEIKPKIVLHENLHKQLTSGKYSDVSLICGEEIIPCHKNILAAHSKVFDAMFSHKNNKEAIENTVKIDMDIQTLQVMLKFLYSGQIILNHEKMMICQSIC